MPQTRLPRAKPGASAKAVAVAAQAPPAGAHPGQAGTGDSQAGPRQVIRANDTAGALPGREAAARLGTMATLASRPQTANVVRHLMWHKALVPDDDDGSRIDRLIDVVTHADDGEHVSIRDAFHRDIAIAFELVMRAELDPWDLDLSKFAALYLAEAQRRNIDIETSGRIILMAWTVLKLQSDDAANRAVFVPQADEAPSWEDLPTWEFAEGLDYAQRVLGMPQAPIDEKIRHKGDRRVTLMELISAFEEVHHEAAARKVLVQQKLEARLSLARRMRGRVGGMMHREDLASELLETWTRIVETGLSPVPFSLLHERSAVDLVQTFTSVLILVREGRVTVTQQDFPRGEIWLTPTRKGAPDGDHAPDGGGHVPDGDHAPDGGGHVPDGEPMPDRAEAPGRGGRTSRRSNAASAAEGSQPSPQNAEVPA